MVAPKIRPNRSKTNATANEHDTMKFKYHSHRAMVLFQHIPRFPPAGVFAEQWRIGHPAIKYNSLITTKWRLVVPTRVGCWASTRCQHGETTHFCNSGPGAHTSKQARLALEAAVSTSRTCSETVATPGGTGLPASPTSPARAETTA